MIEDACGRKSHRVQTASVFSLTTRRIPALGGSELLGSRRVAQTFCHPCVVPGTPRCACQSRAVRYCAMSLRLSFRVSHRKPEVDHERCSSPGRAPARFQRRWPASTCSAVGRSNLDRIPEDVVGLAKLAGGGHNRIFITMRDGFQMVARIPYPVTVLKYYAKWPLSAFSVLLGYQLPRCTDTRLHRTMQRKPSTSSWNSSEAPC
ncbi:hypothetical protein DFH06DRAFT_307362 [Mycena polygramma]|nr:hypothetical protein DFH06DRAFT_307362 [Mycena polygramma]